MSSVGPPTSKTAPRPKRSWLATALVCVVLIAAAILYLHFFPTSQPIGSGPAGPPVPRALFEGVWTDQPVLLLGVGDSVTDGYGASPGMSYFDRLVANPADEFPDMHDICLSSVLPNLSTRNISVSGSNSIECLRDQLGDLELESAETLGLVAITTGGNDLIHFYGRTPPREGAMYGTTLAQARPWIANFEQRLDNIVARLEALFPGGCHIFLTNIYDPSDGVGDPAAAGLPPWEEVLEILAAYNDVVARCAAKHDSVHLVDIHGTFLGHGVHCTQLWREHYCSEDPHYWYYDNLEDPNDRGYDAIRRLFLVEMAKHLAKSPAEREVPEISFS